MKVQYLKYSLLLISIVFLSCKKETDRFPDWTTYKTSNSGLIYDAVYTIAIDENGNKWIGTWNGLSKFNDSTWTSYTSSNCAIEGNWIQDIVIDAIGNKWLMSSDNPSTQPKDVIKFDNLNWTIINSSNSTLLEGALYSLTADNQGNIWFGSSSGTVSKFDGTNWVDFSSDINNTSTWISCISVYLEIMWVGTNKGLISINDKFEKTCFLKDYYILSIATDFQGYSWFGTTEGVWKFDGLKWTNYTTNNSGLANNLIHSIAIDKSGNKWFGTEKGVSKFDGTNWTTYTKDSGLGENNVQTIAIDLEGNKWFGTLGGGVSVYKGD